MNQKLNTAIKKSGMTRTAIAEKIGISRGYLSQIVAEKYNPSLDIIKGLLRVLNVKFEDVFGEETNE